MGKRVRILVLSILCLLMTAGCFVTVGCGGRESVGGGSATKYAVTVEESAGGTVVADCTECVGGGTVNLTVTPNSGYTLYSLVADGTKLTVTDGKASFAMPEKDVTVKATFLAIGITVIEEQVGTYQYSLEVSALTSVAKSYWNATYGETAIKVIVHVEDDRIKTADDSIEMYFGKSGKQNIHLSSLNIGIKISATGEVERYTVSEGAYATADENAIVVEKSSRWSKDGINLTGYLAEISVPYTAFGYAEGTAAADGDITVLPMLTNYTATIGETVSYGDYDKTYPGAYPVIKSTGLIENYYSQGTGNLGSTAKVTAGTKWDLTKDYTSDEDEYEDREVKLTGSDTDNDLLFIHNLGTSVYAEATFTTGTVWNKEAYGKFGLMLFDGATKQGVFYYVDAHTGNKESTTIIGSGFGYVSANNGNYVGWTDLSSTNGAYNSANPITLKMAYDGRSGYLFMWYVQNGEDKLAARTKYTAHGDVTIGFKSFNIEITVKSYSCTNDIESDGFKNHILNLVDGAELGQAAGLPERNPVWDLSKDYASTDANYENREAKLTGHDGADNNLYFRRTLGNSAYVRATFKVDQIFGNEKWGKFGLMLFDGDSHTGLFYYVDAFVGDSGDNVIRGQALGYNLANGAFGAWSDTGAGNVFNTTTKTITLEMTYDNDIITLYYVNSSNESVLVMQHAYVANDPAKTVIGIKSFQYALTVTKYTVNIDINSADFKAHNPKINKRNVDVLFAGDSYMEFWKNYGVWNTLTYDMTGKTLVNVGVGGTRINQWVSRLNALSLQYVPEKIVFHIGVNDIDSAMSVDDTFTALTDLLERYNETFPNATIYWISLIPNNFYIKPVTGQNNTTYNEEYKLLNAKAKALIGNLAYAEYIDMETPFTSAAGKAMTSYYVVDGLHLNANYGYPLWAAVIKQALGVTLAGYNDEYIMGSTDVLAATPAWIYGENSNIAELNYVQADIDKKVKVEESIYYKTIPKSDLLFEAEIKSKDKYNADQYSKVGVALVNEYMTIFGYFESNDGGAQDGAKVDYASIVVRPTFYNDGAYANRESGMGDWVWSSQAGGRITERNIRTAYHKIGLAKRGTKIVLLVDGAVVASMDNIKLISKWNDAHNGFGWGNGTDLTVEAITKFTPAVMTFNRNVEIRSANLLSDMAAIDYAIAPYYNITKPKMSSVTVTIDDNKTKAKATDKISFAVTAENLDKVYAVYGGEEHELTLENGKYSFDMPAENVAIKVTIAGELVVTLNDDIADKVAVDSTSVLSGTKVTFTAQENYYIHSLSANGTAITTKNAQGNFEFVVTENVEITGVCYDMYDGIILDGEFNDTVWTDTVKSKTLYTVANSASFSVMGVNVPSGVLLGVSVVHKKPIAEHIQQNGTDWWHFMGVEVRMGRYNGNRIFATTWNSRSDNCKFGHKTVTNTADGTYTTTYEMLLDYVYFGGAQFAEVPLAFGGVFETGFTSLFGSDWGTPTVYPVRSTKDGLYLVNRSYPVVEGVTLDGKLTDSVWTEGIMSAAHTVEYDIVSGKVALNATKLTNGVLIAARVTSSRSAFYTDNKAEWTAWENYQNVSLNLFANGPHHVYAYAPCINGVANSFVDGVQKTFSQFGSNQVKNADGTYTTTYEIYVPKADYPGQDFTGNIALTFITHTTQAKGVFEFLGQAGTLQGDYFKICGYITDDGMIGLPAPTVTPETPSDTAE